MAFYIHKYGYQGSLDRLKPYGSIAEARLAAINKMKKELGKDWALSKESIYVIRKDFNDKYGSRRGVIGWLERIQLSSGRIVYVFETGKHGSFSDKIPVSETTGGTYKSNINRKLASPYNRAKGKKKKEDNWHPFGL